MAQNDLAEVTGCASTASISRGVSSSYTPASGGGSNVFAFSSLDNGTGAVALYCTMSGANPTTKGAQISAALQRGPSAGFTSFSLWLFAQLTAPNIQGTAYMLGIADADPAHIVLRKGDLASGLPDVAPGQQGVLARSSLTYPDQTWLHLMLDAHLNLCGDLVLNCFSNDLGVNSLSSPVWTTIPGMASVIDDPMGVLSGSPPFNAGRMGFGFHSEDVARVGLVDYVRPGRQT
jgi:hypothetical protein